MDLQRERPYREMVSARGILLEPESSHSCIDKIIEFNLA